MERYPLNRSNAFVMGAFHVGALCIAPFFFTWNNLWLSLSVWGITSSLGIGICYHRMLTHGGIKARWKWFEYTLATVAAVCLQGLPITWVSWHRHHHHVTDIAGHDPHTPRDGRFWSHMDWLLHPNPALRDEKYLKKWVPDLLSQPFYRWKPLLWLPTTVLGIVCLALGGFPKLLWGVVVPIGLGWHATWLVNSATHLWGSQRFQTGDDSRNSWWVALLTFGEGWHNNHHWDPVRPRHGIAWYELDITWLIALLFQTLGLVKLSKSIRKAR